MSALEAQLREALADRYRLIRPLGSGGMAEVFLAEEIRHGRQVAVKVLKPELAAKLGPGRFQQEIAFAARLNHPNILPLLDSGAAAGTLYYTMPYASGESLRERIGRERQLPVAEALRLGEQVARALDYAHREGLIHRDIKPENVLLVDHQAMVADFGIARAVRSAAGTRITETGTTLGTPLYMSPEQAAGDREIDGRSDLYSLACVVYEMLAGQPPFTGPTGEAILRQHLSAAPRPVTELRPNTPPAAAAAIQRALAKAPADRYARAGEFGDALAAARARQTLGEQAVTQALPGAATTPSAAKAGAPGRDRERRSSLVIGVLILALIAAGLLAWRLGRFGSAAHRSAAGREWVMLAEIEGPPEEPSLAPAARDLIAAALDQSNVVATVPREQVRLALRLAGKPDSARVDGDLARELAYRSSIRVLVEGTIHKLGGGYSTVLRAVDSGDGGVILTATDQARDASDLVASIGRVAGTLRHGLGENPESIRAARALPMVATPSFEAYRRYESARRQLNSGDDEGSIALYREALALDPGFAGAWAGLATAYMNAFQPESARVIARRALDMPDRLTDFGRLDLEGKLARLDGDLPRSVQLNDQALTLDLSPVERAVVLNNQGAALEILNRLEAALAQYQASAKIWPIQVPQITLGNIASILIELGRGPEARVEIAKMATAPRGLYELNLAVSEGRLAAAESVATVILQGPMVGLEYKGTALLSLWAMAIRRGELSRAADYQRQFEQGAAASAIPIVFDAAWLDQAWLALLLERAVPRVPSASASGQLSPLGMALAASLAGDTLAVERRFAIAGADVPGVYRHEIEALLVAVANLRAGRRAEAMGALVGQLRQAYPSGHPLYETFRMMSRWMVAGSFEREQPDSAAAYLALIENPPGVSDAARGYQVAAWPFVQRRLALIEARLGHPGEAERHWLAFSESMTHPDAELQPWIDETRATLQASGAMGASPGK